MAVRLRRSWLHAPKREDSEKAESKAKAMEQPRRPGQAGGHAKPTERKTIHSAVELFLRNKKGDGIEDGSYYNQDLTIRKQFLGWTKSRSLVYLDEITSSTSKTFAQPCPAMPQPDVTSRPYFAASSCYCVLQSRLDQCESRTRSLTHPRARRTYRLLQSRGVRRRAYVRGELLSALRPSVRRA